MKKKKFFSYFVAFVIATTILVISSIWTVTYIEENKGQRIPILMYHQLVNSREKADYYDLPVSEFEKQLAWLKTNGFSTTDLNVFISTQFDQAPKTNKPESINLRLKTNKLIIFTFDDGTKDHYFYAFPLLKKYDYTATFFIISSYIDTTLTREEIKEMSNAGTSIESHTHTHRYLDELKDSEIMKELKESKAIIESLTGRPVDFLAIPGGWYDERVLNIAKEVGYKAICTSDIGTNSLKSANFVLRRIDVPGTLTIDEFSKLFSPSKIAFHKTFRQIRLTLRKTIGPSTYRSFWHWYHYSNKTSLVYIAAGCIVIIVPFSIVVIKWYKCRKTN